MREIMVEEITKLKKERKQCKEYLNILMESLDTLNMHKDTYFESVYEFRRKELLNSIFDLKIRISRINDELDELAKICYLDTHDFYDNYSDGGVRNIIMHNGYVIGFKL